MLLRVTVLAAAGAALVELTSNLEAGVASAGRFKLTLPTSEAFWLDSFLKSYVLPKTIVGIAVRLGSICAFEMPLGPACT